MITYIFLVEMRKEEGEDTRVKGKSISCQAFMTTTIITTTTIKKHKKSGK